MKSVSFWHISLSMPIMTETKRILPRKREPIKEVIIPDFLTQNNFFVFELLRVNNVNSWSTLNGRHFVMHL